MRFRSKFIGITSALTFGIVNTTAVRIMSTFAATFPKPYLAPATKSACADVYIIPMFSDNYGYVVVDRGSGFAATIDPAEPDKIITGLSQISCTLKQVLVTHKHDDHAGGNTKFASTFPDVAIIATKYESTPATTQLVGEGDEFTLGELKVQVLYTPCHTSGHVVYLISGPNGDPILFCGDTLFVGGCGRFFEGTPDQMLTNMDRFHLLPPETLVFPAHEFTAGNFKFNANVYPELCEEQYNKVLALRAEGEPTVPSTIADEMSFNLFMRCRDEKLQEKLGCGDPVATMGKLREMKNSFR